MECSYQLASQYFGNGNGGQQAVIVDEPKENRKIMPVSQVAQKVVSTLSPGNGETRSFSTAVGGKRQNFKNTIAACVASDQSVMDGQSVRLRTLESMWVGNSLFCLRIPQLSVERDYRVNDRRLPLRASRLWGASWRLSCRSMTPTDRRESIFPILLNRMHSKRLVPIWVRPWVVQSISLLMWALNLSPMSVRVC